MTRDELIELISDMTSLLGTALAREIELNESIAGAGVESQKLKLDSLKARLAGEKLKLAKLKDAAKRKKDLEKANQHRTTANEGKSQSGMLTLRDATGKVVGFVRVMRDRTEYFSPSGKLVAREIGGMTYDFSRGGRLASRDRQGMRVLGCVK
jgi:hypothetical protein